MKFPITPRSYFVWVFVILSLSSSMVESQETNSSNVCVDYNDTSVILNMTGYERCSDDRLLCSLDTWAQQNCCKCKPDCCDTCNSVNHMLDTPRICPSDSDWTEEPSWMFSTRMGSFLEVVAFVIFGLILFNRVCLKKLLQRCYGNTSSDDEQEDDLWDTQNTSSNEDAVSRKELIHKSFYHQTVLPDKSNTNAESIRSIKNDETNTDETTHNSNKQNDNTIITNDDEEPSLAFSIQNVLSSLFSKREEECSICLAGYEEGEQICVAKTTECNHVFHKDCVTQWLQDPKHACCPLCRVNVLSDESNNTDTI